MAQVTDIELVSGKFLVSAAGAVTMVGATFSLDESSKAALKTALAYAIADVGGLQAALDAKAGTSHSHAFADLTAKPTTLAGYGIADALTAVAIAAAYQPLHANLTALAGGAVAASLLTGTIDVARLPFFASGVQVVSASATIADLSSPEQDAIITAGAIVTTTDGRRWVWNGIGSKIMEASYVQLADITPDWSVLANKPSTFAPAAHASAHAAGGGDALKLDDLAAPDDNTDLDASTVSHGLLRKLNNDPAQFLNGQGNWATPAGGGGAYANVLHVAESGGDYTTLAAAKAAAASGDLVIVHPGTYTATASILKAGVNWHFEAGAVVTQTPADTDTVGFLNDPTGVASKITGAGKFVLDCTGRTGAVESATITLNTPVASDYISLYKLNGDRVNFWFSVDATGSAPGVGGTDVEVALTSGFSAADASAALYSAIAGISTDYNATDNGGSVTLADSGSGARTDTTSSDGSRLPVVLVQDGYPFQPIALVKSIAGSLLTIDAAEIEVVYPGAEVGEVLVPTAIMAVDGSLTVHAPLITGTGDFTNAVWWQNGPCVIRADTILAGCYGVWSQVTATPTGDLDVTAENIVCPATDTGSPACPLFTSGSEATAALWVTAKTLRHAGTSTAHYCIYLLGSEKLYFQGQKTFGNVELSGTGEVYLHVQKASPVANGQNVLSCSNACKAFVRIDRLDVAGFTSISAGTFATTAENRLQIGSFIGNSTSTGVTLGGIANLVESRIDLTAGTNKTAATISGGTPTIQGCVLLGSGTGKDINVTSGSVSVSGGFGTGTDGHFVTTGTVNFKSPF